MRRILDKLSYHAVYDASILDALEFARAHGFAGVQPRSRRRTYCIEVRPREKAAESLANLRRILESAKETP